MVCNKAERTVKHLNRIIKFTLAVIMFTAFSNTALALEVIPSGECVGVKLYTDGLIVTDTSDVTTRDGTVMNIAKGYDIEKGDIIEKINGLHAVSNEMFSRTLKNSPQSVTLTISRRDKEFETVVTPADTQDGPKLGLWLRDSTAGLGTITCCYNGRFAALGHGICDIDTGNIMPIGRGIIQGCSITSIIKGVDGAPGALTGSINGAFLGTISDNMGEGLFGSLAISPEGAPMEVAKKTEVKCGPASILADVDGNGVREYSVEIKRISPVGSGKDMVIRVTDNSLIEKTGGIVQGMSGAPIIQNNRLAGAVTHVFVNDAKSGYGILAEHMLKNF